MNITLQEYILVDSEKILVMTYSRNNYQTWSLSILETLQDTLHLTSIDLKIPITNIYGEVGW